MPRSKRIYTDVFPYHICARTNNKEAFQVPLDILWRIFEAELANLEEKYQARIHAFVLMSNHYHLIMSASSDYNLGFLMAVLQTRVSKAINNQSGRINHTFGGTYKSSLISNPAHYAHVTKYVFRNPVTAGITSLCQNYKFSTLSLLLNNTKITYNIKPPTPPIHQIIDAMTRPQLIAWLNYEYRKNEYFMIQRGLDRKQFKINTSRTYKNHWMDKDLHDASASQK